VVASVPGIESTCSFFVNAIFITYFYFGAFSKDLLAGLLPSSVMTLPWLGEGNNFTLLVFSFASTCYETGGLNSSWKIGETRKKESVLSCVD
jgi:hypothetical protein